MNELSEPVIINRGDGSTVTFPRVSAYDRSVRFRAAFRTWRRLMKVEALTMLGITGDAAAAQIDAFEARRLRDGDLHRFADEPEGQYEALLLSLRVKRPEASYADVDLLGLTQDEMHRAAAGVLGLRLVPANDPLPGGAGAAPSPTATSEGSATNSAATSTSPTPSISPSTSSTGA